MLGPSTDSVIKLSPNAMMQQHLGVCEGLETGLSLLVMGQAPIWVCGSAWAVETFPVIDRISCLTVFADDDEAGIAAAREVERRWVRAGRECHVEVPNGGDWNDVLRNLRNDR
jgi:hypothetical protein